MLLRITQHHRTLCTPQETRTDTEKSTGENQEAGILIDIVGKERGHVEEVA